MTKMKTSIDFISISLMGTQFSTLLDHLFPSLQNGSGANNLRDGHLTSY